MFVWNQVLFEVHIDFWRPQRVVRKKQRLSFSGHPMLIRKKVQQNSSWVHRPKKTVWSDPPNTYYGSNKLVVCRCFSFFQRICSGSILDLICQEWPLENSGKQCLFWLKLSPHMQTHGTCWPARNSIACHDEGFYIIWPNRIIFHQPRFPWNMGSHFPPSATSWGEVVWGRYDLTKYHVQGTLHLNYHLLTWLPPSGSTG